MGSAATSPALPPLSLYVHFPWCVRKCPYCDFNSYTLHGDLPADRYIGVPRHGLQIQRPCVFGPPAPPGALPRLGGRRQGRAGPLGALPPGGAAPRGQPGRNIMMNTA